MNTEDFAKKWKPKRAKLATETIKRKNEFIEAFFL